MFGSPFNRDLFRRAPVSSAYSHSNYPAPSQNPYYHSQHTYDPPRQHGRTPRPQPPPRYHSPLPQHHRRLPRRPSHYSDISPSSSGQDTPDEPYPHYMDPSGTLHPRMPTGGSRRRNRGQSLPSDNSPIDIEAVFTRINTKVPRQTAEKLGRNEILILPLNLTHLRVQMRSSHGTETLRVNVAGDMQFRDVVKQLVPESGWSGGIRAYVKMRAAWQEPGRVLVSQIVELGQFVLNERGEVEVKIEIGGGGRGSGGREGVVRSGIRDV